MDRDEIVAALEDGDLCRLISRMTAGLIPIEDFLAAYEKYERKHWLRNFFLTLFGLKYD